MGFDRSDRRLEISVVKLQRVKLALGLYKSFSQRSLEALIIRSENEA